MVKVFREEVVTPQVDEDEDSNVVQEVGRSPLTVATGTATEEVLEKVAELAKARARFHQVITKAGRRD